MLSASRALVIRTLLRARIETVFLIVTIIVGAAVLPTSKALIVGVAFKVKCVFPRVIVIVGGGR